MLIQLTMLLQLYLLSPWGASWASLPMGY